MRNFRYLRVAAIAVVASVLLVLAFSAPAPAGSARTIYMSALEYKGGTNVSGEAYPPTKLEGTKGLLPRGSGFGYGLKGPDSTGRWQVESYRFEPGFAAARLDERVRLEIVGINGSMHSIRLVSPSGVVVETPVVTRGRMTIVTFRADEAGIWNLVCDTHPPAMTADILVF